jgi:hypothetical protein
VLGIVKDAATEVPLPGAKIKLYVREEELAVLQSDSEGTFEHKSEAQYPGEILICKVEKAGYEPQKVIQEFEEDEVTLTIKLVPGEEEKIGLTVNHKDETGGGAEVMSEEDRYLGRQPWLMAAEGIIALIIGALILAWPGMTLVTLTWIVGIFVLLAGICALIALIGSHKGQRGDG